MMPGGVGGQSRSRGGARAATGTSAGLQRRGSWQVGRDRPPPGRGGPTCPSVLLGPFSKMTLRSSPAFLRRLTVLR